MSSFLNREAFSYRMMQLFILIAHLILLKWIVYTLYEGGVLPFKTLLYHFLGVSAYGAILIRFCAWFYKKQYNKELEKNAGSKQLDN